MSDQKDFRLTIEDCLRPLLEEERLKIAEEQILGNLPTVQLPSDKHIFDAAFKDLAMFKNRKVKNGPR